jgi:hypothetical protein
MTLLVVLLEAVEILDEAEAVKMAVVEVAATTTGHPVKSIRGQTRMHQGVIIIVIPASKSYCCSASY